MVGISRELLYIYTFVTCLQTIMQIKLWSEKVSCICRTRWSTTTMDRQELCCADCYGVFGKTKELIKVKVKSGLLVHLDYVAYY